MKGLFWNLIVIALVLTTSSCSDRKQQNPPTKSVVPAPAAVRIAPSEGGELIYDGLIVGYGIQDGNFVVDCHAEGAPDDDLLLPNKNVHGLQPSQILPKTTMFEKRLLPVRGTRYCVSLSVSNIVAKGGRFVSGTIEIAVQGTR